MPAREAPCFLCGEQSNMEETPTIGGCPYDVFSWDCPKCGKYVYDLTSGDQLKELQGDSKFRLSCVLRERVLRGETGRFGLLCGDCQPGPKTIHKHLKRWWRVDELLQEFPTAVELIDRSLLNLSRRVQHPMDSIKLDREEARYVFFSSINAQRLLGYMDEMRLLRKEAIDRGGIQFSIAPAGWQRISDLQRESPESKQAFVAMWFAAEMDTLYQQAIKPAVEDAGFDCKRIDSLEHNNKICDEIIAEIRRSRFVIADFTGQRGGVYFEAGFAMGLGIPVIWTVDKDEIEQVHFDTRQYNHIVYEAADDLRQRLRNRIAATIH